MTDFAKISLSTDRVRSSQQPETWNIGPQAVIAACAAACCLGLNDLVKSAWYRRVLG